MQHIWKIVLIARVFANPVCSISVKIYPKGLLLKLVFFNLKINFYKMHLDMQSPQFLKVHYVLFYFAFILDCTADLKMVILNFLMSKIIALQLRIHQHRIKTFMIIK